MTQLSGSEGVELDADEVFSVLAVVVLLELFPAPLELLSVDDVLLLDDVPDDGVVAGVLAGASGPTNTTLSRLR